MPHLFCDNSDNSKRGADSTFCTLPHIPDTLNALPNPPKALYYVGEHLELLDCAHKIAIVGSRSPNQYTKAFVLQLAAKIARAGGVVVSGGALGTDITAHIGAMPRTIMISPSSLDIIYPKSNQSTIKDIIKHALVLSEYESGYMPNKFSFLERNRIVVALSDIIIIPQADKFSGSMQSARIAGELNKPIFVLPHRLGESEGTNALLAEHKARAIYDINAFIKEIFGIELIEDDIITFCATNPSFEDALAKFGDKIYEYELSGKIERKMGRIYVL